MLLAASAEASAPPKPERAPAVRQPTPKKSVKLTVGTGPLGVTWKRAAEFTMRAFAQLLGTSVLEQIEPPVLDKALDLAVRVLMEKIRLYERYNPSAPETYYLYVESDRKSLRRIEGLARSALGGEAEDFYRGLLVGATAVTKQLQRNQATYAAAVEETMVELGIGGRWPSKQ